LLYQFEIPPCSPRPASNRLTGGIKDTNEMILIIVKMSAFAV
jgi:hypothetical protein